jgi:hypothetical protein
MVPGKTQEVRPKVPDSEKVTINLGFVDLGTIDLLVHDGFYANRTDFIRTAIRNQLDRQADAVRQSVAPPIWKRPGTGVRDCISMCWVSPV